MTTCQMVNNNF